MHYPCRCTEFQKRLAHAHLLLTLADHCKLKTPQAIDNIVSATIPDPVTEPRLYDMVRRHMVHGPCGENPGCPCMREDKCSKSFPKEFADKTVILIKPYLRPDDGRSVKVGPHYMDNRWIVPYDKFLLLKYNCHIVGSMQLLEVHQISS